MKWLFLLFLGCTMSCRHGSEMRDDQVYSRHLQRQVKLSILNTPIPADKSLLNLLILNDGQEMVKLRIKTIVDSLFKAGAIQPLVVVGIHAGDRMQEFGVAGQSDYEGRGSRAQFYEAFIDDELYPFIKKKAGVRKFKSIAIAGCSLGGLLSLDMAWDHADKIDKIGAFSGSFWWRDKSADDSTYSDEKNRILYAKIKSSRKRPKLEYWFYAGGAEENADRDKDGITDALDDTQDIVALLKEKKNVPASDIVLVTNPAGQHDWQWWSEQMPAFLVWAFGR